MGPDIEVLTDENYGQADARQGVTVIDFWAAWRGPCRIMAPQFKRAAELRPQHHFAKVDVKFQPALAARFGIQSIPTLAVLGDGELVATQSGVLRADQLVEALDRITADPGFSGSVVAGAKAAA